MRPTICAFHTQGNRSLQFQHGLLSIGNGCGEVWLYDLRAGDYLHMPRESGVSAERQCLHLGKGWLERNETYRWEVLEEHDRPQISPPSTPFDLGRRPANQKS